MRKTGQKREKLPGTKDLDRVRIEGDEETDGSFATGPADDLFQNPLVAAVNPVEGTEGGDRTARQLTKRCETVKDFHPHLEDGPSAHLF